MSKPVDITQLHATLAGYGFAYLVTVGESAAHVLAVMPELRDRALHVDGIGRHSTANAGARPAVTLVWPPVEEGGYSLIVDGDATVGDGSLTVEPVKAILHRPAPDADGRRTGSDCRPVD